MKDIISEHIKRMNKEKALEILKDCIKPNGGLYHLGWYMAWNIDDKDITLDGDFTLDELKAVVWYMEHMKETD